MMKIEHTEGLLCPSGKYGIKYQASMISIIGGHLCVRLAPSLCISYSNKSGKICTKYKDLSEIHCQHQILEKKIRSVLI